jgi:hypothetical protein
MHCYSRPHRRPRQTQHMQPAHDMQAASTTLGNAQYCSWCCTHNTNHNSAYLQRCNLCTHGQTRAGISAPPAMPQTQLQQPSKEPHRRIHYDKVSYAAGAAETSGIDEGASTSSRGSHTCNGARIMHVCTYTSLTCAVSAATQHIQHHQSSCTCR